MNISSYNQLIANATAPLSSCEEHVNNIITHRICKPLTTFSINLQADRIVAPYDRYGKPFSIKYAMAELLWYAVGDARATVIAPYGKRWLDMADDAGLVNSNYGATLRSHYGWHDIKNMLDVLAISTLEFVHFSLLTQDNMTSTTDVPCNDLIEIRKIHSGNDTTYEMRVVARSIDLVYGLPYDMFMAQCFAHAAKILTNGKVTITRLTYEIINCHIYDADASRGWMEHNSHRWIAVSTAVVDEVVRSVKNDNVCSALAANAQQFKAKRDQLIDLADIKFIDDDAAIMNLFTSHYHTALCMPIWTVDSTFTGVEIPGVDIAHAFELAYKRSRRAVVSYTSADANDQLVAFAFLNDTLYVYSTDTSLSLRVKR